MLVLRCTRKLLERWGPAVSSPPESTTVLGDWYAKPFAVGRKRYTVMISGRSRIALVMPNRGLAEVMRRFPDELGALLLQLGARPDAAEREIEASREIVPALTNNRSLVGTLNEFASMASSAMSDDPQITLGDLSLWLSRSPVGPLGLQRPADVALVLLSQSGNGRGRTPMPEIQRFEQTIVRRRGVSMALPVLVRQLVDSKLASFYERRLPAHVREEIRLFHTYRGNSVTLIEARPPYIGPSEWSQLRVAQFRYDSETRAWTLYYADRNSRWHWYWDIEPTTDFDDLLREVDEDPTGIFWG